MEKQKQFSIIAEHTEQVSPGDYVMRRHSLQFDETATLKEVKEAMYKQMSVGMKPRKFYAYLSENDNSQ